MVLIPIPTVLNPLVSYLSLSSLILSVPSAPHPTLCHRVGWKETCSIYIDHLALCKHIHAHQCRIFYSPSEALVSDRDVLLQIESILNVPYMNLTIHHV